MSRQKKPSDFNTLKQYDLYMVKMWSKTNKAKPQKPKQKKKTINRRKKYNDYLKSDQWAIIKIEMRDFHGNKCQLCTRTNDLEVHHRHYNNFGNEEPKDLLLVCKTCHKRLHGK